MIARDEVTATARGWLGTRFHHQGRLKKTAAHAGGVDCLGLLVGVAAELELCDRSGGLLAALDARAYPHFTDGRELLETLRAALVEIPACHAGEADVLLFSMEGVPRHLAICTDAGMIHAYVQARRVVEHPLDDWWRARLIRAFRLPGIE